VPAVVVAEHLLTEMVAMAAAVDTHHQLFL
jgi:hypothetical protein